MKPSMHPAAPDHLPGFITAPGEVDVLFVSVTIFLTIAIMAIGTFYFKRYGIHYSVNRTGYIIQVEVFCILVLVMMLTQNKYFGIAVLLLAIIRIPDIITLVKSKILRRWRAGSVELSATLHQSADTSETDLPLGATSESATVARDPKKWLLH